MKVGWRNRLSRVKEKRSIKRDIQKNNWEFERKKPVHRQPFVEMAQNSLSSASSKDISPRLFRASVSDIAEPLLQPSTVTTPDNSRPTMCANALKKAYTRAKATDFDIIYFYFLLIFDGIVVATHCYGDPIIVM